MDESRPRSLEHPLPVGMRDLLPEEAAARRALSRRVLDRFALAGYRLVTPPAFELADVVERGLGPLAAGDVLRFVEPESGDVAVLGPDMTPQIARMVATRLRDHAPPIRLAYEGTVIRRKAGRAKKHRQIPQVGVELCGAADAGADVELLGLAGSALRAVGLSRFSIDVSDAGIVRSLCAGVEEPALSAITRALSIKDEAQVEALAAALPALSPRVRAALTALPRLHGTTDVLEEAAAALEGTAAAASLARLRALVAEATARGLGPHLTVDVGEVRGFAYYTGTIFSIYAEGPGEAIGAGGRYDELLGRFGAPMPAIGFGLDLDALASAQAAAGVVARGRGSVVVVGAEQDPRLAALRDRGVVAVAAPSAEAALAYARSWGHTHVWSGSLLREVGGRAGNAAGGPGSTGQALPGPVDESVAAVVRVLETLPRGA